MLRSRSPLSSGGFCPWRWSLVIRHSSSERTVLRLVSAPSLLSNEHSGPGPGAAVEDFSSCENGVAAWARPRIRRDLQTASRLGKGWFHRQSIQRLVVPSSVRELGEEAFGGCEGLREVVFEPGSRLERLGESCFGSAGSWRSSFRGASASSGSTPSWAVWSSVRSASRTGAGCEAWDTAPSSARGSGQRRAVPARAETNGSEYKP